MRRILLGAALVVLFALLNSASAHGPSHSTCASSPYPSLDGSCHNLDYPNIGKAGSFYRRGRDGAEYATGNQPIAYPQRQHERVISNKICRGDPSQRDTIRHSLLATQFGQFINHDLEFNGFEDPTTLSYTDALIVPEPDDSFCYAFANVFSHPPNLTLVNTCGPDKPLPLFTTKFSEIEIVRGVPQVVNHASSWLDLNTIYSVNATQSTALRTGSGGRLLTRDYVNVTTDPGRIFNIFGVVPSGRTAPVSCIDCPPSWGQTGGVVPVPPLLDPTLPQPGGQVFGPDQIFVSGDGRVGENAALSMFHTLFIRNHNRHATKIATQHPNWTDEKIFQRARRNNIAEYQNVVLYQYFPAEFGHYFAAQVGEYNGYNDELDVNTNNAFAVGAFRYGHSSFHNYPPRNSCGGSTLFGYNVAEGVNMFAGGQTGGPITPVDVFVEVGAWENVIRGLITEVTSPNDIFINDVLRDLPFGFPAGGTDVMALDIHRGRENGLANYVRLQRVYGISSGRIYGTRGCPEWLEFSDSADPIACFRRLIPYNDTLLNAVATLYRKVNNIDGFVGLMLEPHVPGTSFGATLGKIVADTYKRVRDGDRFWFENPTHPSPFSDDDIDDIRRVTMGELIRKNFHFPSAGQIPDNPFLSPVNYLSTLQNTCH